MEERKRAKCRAKLEVVPASEGRKATLLTHETLVRFVRLAYPDASVIITVEETHDEDVVVWHSIQVMGRGYFLVGKGRTLRAALEVLILKQNFKLDAALEKLSHMG
jgi:hypothetical protein